MSATEPDDPARRVTRKWRCPICRREGTRDGTCDDGHEPTRLRSERTSYGDKQRRGRQMKRLREGAARLQRENTALRALLKSHGIDPKSGVKDDA